MRTYDLIADLPVRIDEYALEGLEQHVSSDFTRRTTVIHLHGNGEAGHDEDVAWDSIDQERALQRGPLLPLVGDWTLRSFSAHLAGLDLYRFKLDPTSDSETNRRRRNRQHAGSSRCAGRVVDAVAAALGRPPVRQPRAWCVTAMSVLTT